MSSQSGLAGRIPRVVAFLGLGQLLLTVRTRAMRRNQFELNYDTLEALSDTPLQAGRHLVDIPDNPDGHLVTYPLPLTKDGEELTIKNWAGHLPASDDGHKYFFYWLFEPETVDEDTPLLIWLNGGPGCSSMDGLFLENGPIQWTLVDGKYMLQQNPHSWHLSPAYTLYIDQPVGTGLSFTTNKGYPTNDEEVNIDFYYFLVSFFEFHADKFVADQQVSRPLFFSGESHAGHYIPSMMNYILEKNRNDGTLHIPLTGAAIGNGWFDPMNQYAAAEAAYGHGLLGIDQVNAFDEEEKKCQKLLQEGNYRSSVCFDLLDSIVAQSYGDKSPYRVNQYDARKAERSLSKTFPNRHEAVECYLGGKSLPSWAPGTMDCSVKDSVLEIIHASAATAAKQRFRECTDPPYNALAHQDGKGVVDDIVEVLQHPTRPLLLFFNGVDDLICNHVGNEKGLDNLPWNGKNQWLREDRYAWFAGNRATKPAGFFKRHENLMFLKLLDAGHMVPLDIPEFALEMMKIFMAGLKFADSLQDMDSSTSAPPPSCPVCATCPVQECPNCIAQPAPSNETDRNCTYEAIKAKEEVLKKVDSSSFPSISFAWAIPMIALLLVLWAIISFRKSKEEHDLVVAGDGEIGNTEYHDEPVLDESG